MRCDEFMDVMNRLLDERRINDERRVNDERRANHDELRTHMRACRACRHAWETFQRYEQLLGQTDQVSDERLTDRVLHQKTRDTQEHRRATLGVVAGFVGMIAAGLLAIATVFPFLRHQTDVQQTRQTGPLDVATVRPEQDWSQWYAGTDLPSVYELWNLPWTPDGANPSVAASVSSGLRPVRNTMSSAFKVIRQNVLPTAPQPGSDDGQAGHANGRVFIA